jgi:hypothetical protein
MYSVTNIPTEKSRHQIKALVEGDAILIRAVEQPGTYGIGMTTMHVGDHMLAKPEALRKMIGEAITVAIRFGRDAGYAHAQADMRRVIGAAQE